MSEKTVENLKEELFLNDKNGYFKIDEKTEKDIYDFAKGYSA